MENERPECLRAFRSEKVGGATSLADNDPSEETLVMNSVLAVFKSNSLFDEAQV